MSRAFVKEDHDAEASEAPPERAISSHPNLVTDTGLKVLERKLQLARDALVEAKKADEAGDRNQRSALPMRDIRYYSERLRTAQLVTLTPSPATVGFGHVVSLRYDDGRRFAYRIVGEDEADPAKGMISFVSPVAQTLMGKSVGDSVTVGEHEIEILDIS